ncbi:MAG: hypothetical protein AABY49_04045 [Planctomycetota bacterium]
MSNWFLYALNRSYDSCTNSDSRITNYRHTDRRLIKSDELTEGKIHISSKEVAVQMSVFIIS